MTAGLRSPSGSKMEAVIANTFLFVLPVAFVCGTWVALLRTCSWSVVGIQSNPRVVNPLSLASDNVWLVRFNSVGMLSRNEGWLDDHFLNVNPAVLSSDVNCSCKLVASSRVGCHLEDHLRRNHCSVLELILDDDSCSRLQACCQIWSWSCPICYSVELVFLNGFFSRISP